MTTKEKTPTNGAKESSKKKQLATQIVAARDRFVLGLFCFAPDLALVGVMVALGVCHAL